MLKTNLLCASALLLSSTFTGSANAGDNPVNCRTESTQYTVYYGNASCTAYSGSERRTLSSYYHASLSPSVYLSEFGFSCFATLPFSQLETSTSTKCDYTPQANIRDYIFYDGTAYTAALRLNSGASDRDGSIVKTEWWVNGQSYGASVPTFTVNSPTSFSIRQRVTDNDGYTDETSKSVFVSPNNDPCFEGERSC